MQNPRSKFEITNLSSFADMFDRMPKIVGSRDLGHAHFRENYLCTRLAPACTKFEVSSSSSFGDIDTAIVDMTLNDQLISYIRLPIGC